jgi:hypothetical protein
VEESRKAIKWFKSRSGKNDSPVLAQYFLRLNCHFALQAGPNLRKFWNPNGHGGSGKTNQGGKTSEPTSLESSSAEPSIRGGLSLDSNSMSSSSTSSQSNNIGGPPSEPNNLDDASSRSNSMGSQLNGGSSSEQSNVSIPFSQQNNVHDQSHESNKLGGPSSQPNNVMCSIFHSQISRVINHTRQRNKMAHFLA